MGERIGSLFSGAGGLDLAVQAVFGGEVVWHAEIDKAASRVLAHRFPGVPNLGSVTDIDWAAVPAVDVLCGGFPCQDVSAAGKRAGIKAGTRSGLWSVFADAIDALRPQWVVIENVRGLLSATAHRTVEDDADGDVEPAAGVMGDGAGRPVLRAAGAVLGDLADIGYDAQWATVAAADVGAPHRRERVFILAADTSRGELQRRGICSAMAGASSGGEGTPQQRQRHGNATGNSSADAADSLRNGWDEARPESARIVRGFDEHGVALLPTPCVVDRLATTDMTLDQWDESRRSQKERGVGSFGPRGDSLGAAVLRVEEGTVDERPDYSSSHKDDGVALLPTPTAQAARHGADSRFGGGNGDVSNLWQIAHLLPTPRNRDGKGATSSRSGDNKHDLPSALAAAPDVSDDESGLGSLPLLPAPASADGQRGQDFARANREGSGGDDLVTLAVKADRDSAWGKYEPAIRRWESLVGPAPAPTEPNKNGNPRLSAAFSEWLMGWPAGWVTDPAIGISRNDQLRIIGNGVCPQQAAAALRYLLAIAVGTHTHTPDQPADMTLLPTPTSRDHKGPNQRGDTTCLHGAINSEVTP